MAYFHVSVLYLEPGNTISPGAWGARMFAIGVGHNLYFRERELERARLRVDPNLPSRWSSTYALTDPAFAQNFAVIQANSSGTVTMLYEVEPQAGARQCLTPMGYLDDWHNLLLPNVIDPWCDAYWQAAPYGGQDAELVVEGTLEVRGLIGRFLPS